MSTKARLYLLFSTAVFTVAIIWAVGIWSNQLTEKAQTKKCTAMEKVQLLNGCKP